MGTETDMKGSSSSPSREQLLAFFDSMLTVYEQPEVKQRVAVAVRAGGDAVAVSSEIQGEVFLQMGIDPKAGQDSLASVRAVYQDDRECIVKYLKFVEREELAHEEAELGQHAFQLKRQQFKEVQDQQLKLLHQLRSLPADVQEGFIQGLQEKLKNLANNDFEELVEFYKLEQHGLKDSHRAP